MGINSNDNKNLSIPFFRTNIAKRFLHYQGFKAWNYETSTELKKQSVFTVQSLY